jgi:predicted Zn-ribbon and HTH transcriptional regulator
MGDENLTRREKVRELLSYSVTGMSPEDIAKRLSTREYEMSQSEVIEHIDHIRKSLRNERNELTGQPPKCRECDFENFRKIINIPSQCPECRSDSILQPRFKIQSPEDQR